MDKLTKYRIPIILGVLAITILFCCVYYSLYDLSQVCQPSEQEMESSQSIISIAAHIPTIEVGASLSYTPPYIPSLYKPLSYRAVPYTPSYIPPSYIAYRPSKPLPLQVSPYKTKSISQHKHKPSKKFKMPPRKYTIGGVTLFICSCCLYVMFLFIIVIGYKKH